MLNFLKKAIPDPSFSDSIRHREFAAAANVAKVVRFGQPLCKVLGCSSVMIISQTCSAVNREEIVRYLTLNTTFKKFEQKS